MRLRAGWTLVVAIPAAALFLLAAMAPAAPDFKERVLLCGKAPIADRFPCYKAAIADLWDRGANVTTIAAYDAYTLEPYTPPGDPGSPFGNNCHTFYHTIGDFIAERVTREPERAMAIAPATCTGGAYMAVLHRLDLYYNHSLDRLRQLYRACPEVPAICAHVTGHALFEKHIASLFQALDGISSGKFGHRVPPYDYSNDGNWSAAFAECPQVVEPRNVVQCYTGVAHSQFAVAKLLSQDPQDALKECDWSLAFRSDCRTNFALRWGYGQVEPLLEGNNSTEAIAACAALGADLAKECNRGTGGGLGLLLESRTVGAEGDRLPPEKVADIILHYVNLCRRMVPEHVPACIRGLVATPKFQGLYLRSGLVDPDVEAAIASKPIPIGG